MAISLYTTNSNSLRFRVRVKNCNRVGSGADVFTSDKAIAQALIPSSIGMLVYNDVTSMVAKNKLCGKSIEFNL